MCLLTETGGLIKLDGLGGVFTSRRDMGLPISPHNGKLPQTIKCLRGSVQTEGKYSKLIYLVSEGKTKVLPVVWMYQYIKVV